MAVRRSLCDVGSVQRRECRSEMTAAIVMIRYYQASSQEIRLASDTKKQNKTLSSSVGIDDGDNDSSLVSSISGLFDGH